MRWVASKGGAMRDSAAMGDGTATGNGAAAVDGAAAGEGEKAASSTTAAGVGAVAIGGAGPADGAAGGEGMHRGVAAASRCSNRLHGTARIDYWWCQLTFGSVVRRQGCHVSRSHHPMRQQHVPRGCGARELPYDA